MGGARIKCTVNISNTPHHLLATGMRSIQSLEHLTSSLQTHSQKPNTSNMPQLSSSGLTVHTLPNHPPCIVLPLSSLPIHWFAVKVPLSYIRMLYVIAIRIEKTLLAYYAKEVLHGVKSFFIHGVNFYSQDNISMFHQ